MQPYVTGAVQAKINQANLFRLPVVLAAASVNEAFGEIIDPLYHFRRSNVEESRSLADLRDTLLPELISGTIRVPDAERLVGEAV